MMVEFINQISSQWYEVFILSTVHSSIFLSIVFALLYLFRKSDLLFLKFLTVIGLIKFLIPPLFKLKSIAPVPVPFITSVSAPAIVSSSEILPKNLSLSFEFTLMSVWILISLSILIYTLIQYLRLKNSLKNTDVINIANQVTVSNSSKISFFKSPEQISPYVIGFFKQKVVLPKDWDTWSRHQRDMVVTHELSHIQQKDHWINILKVVVFAFNFFNPLVWIIINKLNQYTELVCDDLTMNAVGLSNSEYSKQLLQLSERFRYISSVIPTTLAFSESYKIIKERISHHLSHREDYRMKLKRNHLKLYVILCTVLMIPFLWRCETDQPVKSTSKVSEKIFSTSDISKWPMPIENPEPIYPQEAIDKKIDGLVQILVVINEKGELIEASVDERYSIPLLNEAALEAVKKCTFSPATKEGVAVKSKTVIPFYFDLDFIDPEVTKANNLYRFYDVSVKPTLIHKERPVYPEDAKVKGIQGLVVLTLTIDEKGDVDKVKIYMSADPLLTNAAVEAGKKCKFEPATVNGKPVKVKMNIPIRFALK